MKKLKAILIDKGPLSRAEARVLLKLCEGYTRQEIADSWPYRSISTINRHVESIAKKLDSANQAEIVSTAVALEMVRYEFRNPQHSLTNLVLILLMVNITSSHIDMRRGPSSPRPVRTVRTSSRLNRPQRQYP